MKKIVFSLATLVALSAAAQTGRSLQPTDLYRLNDVSSPQISPDGKWVSYVLSSVDTAKDRRTTDVWMVSWDGKENVQLTTSPNNESNPKWSPDGRYLSFVSSRKAGEEKEEDRKSDV